MDQDRLIHVKFEYLWAWTGINESVYEPGQVDSCRVW